MIFVSLGGGIIFFLHLQGGGQGGDGVPLVIEIIMARFSSEAMRPVSVRKQKTPGGSVEGKMPRGVAVAGGILQGKQCGGKETNKVLVHSSVSSFFS